MGRHGENIRRRNDGRWEGRYKAFDKKKGRYIYRSVYGRAYEEAKEKLTKAKLGLTYQLEKKQRREEADSQKSAASSSLMLPFSHAAEEWLEEIQEKRKYSTYVKYYTVYRIHLANVVGSCSLSSASSAELEKKIFDHISEGARSESLRKSIYCVVNQVLRFANIKYSLGIPLLEKPSIKPKKKTVAILSKAEQARLFSGIYHETDKYKIAVLLCLHTGLRLGELCALQWSDLDFHTMTLLVNRTVQRITVQQCQQAARTFLLESEPKSESSRRTIPLTAEMVELLAQLKGSQPYIFGGNKPLEPRTMQYWFQRIGKEAGIHGRSFHILRHTFATNCIENHMDVKSLSEILGHSDVKITLNRYVHPTMDAKRKQLGVLLDFYGQICGQAVQKRTYL